MKRIIIFYRVLLLLGPSWALFRVKQAVLAKIGYWENKTSQRDWNYECPSIVGQFWNIRFTSDSSLRAQDIASGKYLFFFRHTVHVGLIPDWFANPFAKNTETDGLKTAHWSKISDFGAGDIKGVWELSRFAWVYPLLAGFQQDRDENFAETFWDLLEDWAAHNPPNTGVHWKCGQEIAIRCFALTCAYFVLHSAQVSTEERCELLREILFESGKRIQANIAYALSQKNNHGISEAAGLFSLGLLFGNTNWTKQGQSLLESQALELIYDDGSFSQHSVNYHRVMLHDYLWAIQLGRANNLEFSTQMLARVRQAGIWLLTFCDQETGRCPNLGSNDGALIFPVTTCDYLDFRPTIQAVGAVVDGKTWLPEGKWDGLFLFLSGKMQERRRETGGGRPEEEGIVGPMEGFSKPLASSLVPLAQNSLPFFENGGYALFSNSKSKLLFRCPKSFRHRPAQCDMLHVDLFHNGINILRDGGTYSYNCEQPWQDYFKSVAAHNTIQFDDHDQMPKLSRFLYGKWPKAEVVVDESSQMVKAGFTDWKGCRHERTVQSHENGFTVIDRIRGFKEKAVLRWRLAPELDWVLDGSTCSSKDVSLVIASDKNLNAIKISEGWESLYYQERTPLSVLEVDVGPDCRELVTEIELL